MPLEGLLLKESVSQLFGKAIHRAFLSTMAHQTPETAASDASQDRYLRAILNFFIWPMLENEIIKALIVMEVFLSP